MSGLNDPRLHPKFDRKPTIRETARAKANLVPVNVRPGDTARIADAASDVWESHTATAQLREAGIDLDRLVAVLESSENWGHLVHAYEVLSVLGAVRNEMEALG